MCTAGKKHGNFGNRKLLEINVSGSVAVIVGLGLFHVCKQYQPKTTSKSS